MRVVLADDAMILREGLSRLLQEAGFDVVGQAGDADELLQFVQRERPDVAIVDIRMPPTHTDEGLRAAKTIRERWPTVGVLILSQHVNSRYALESALDRQRRDRLSAQRTRVRSRRAHDQRQPRRTGRLGARLGGCRRSSVGRPRRSDNPLEQLTEREREVLALIAEGRSNRAIAERLFVSEHTVEKHIKNIFGALRLPQSIDDHRRVLAVVTYLNSQ